MGYGTDDDYDFANSPSRNNKIIREFPTAGRRDRQNSTFKNPITRNEDYEGFP